MSNILQINKFSIAVLQKSKKKTTNSIVSYAVCGCESSSAVVAHVCPQPRNYLSQSAARHVTSNTPRFSSVL